MNDITKICNEIASVEPTEDLARLTGEALQLIAKRGRQGWEALFEMVNSLDNADEINECLAEFASGEQEPADLGDD